MYENVLQNVPHFCCSQVITQVSLSPVSGSMNLQNPLAAMSVTLCQPLDCPVIEAMVKY